MRLLPLVFAQPTERNERICSLLSAVALRSVRADFTSVIRSSFPSSSIETEAYTETETPQLCLKKQQQRQADSAGAAEAGHRRDLLVLWIESQQDSSSNNGGHFLRSIIAENAFLSAELFPSDEVSCALLVEQLLLETVQPDTPVLIVVSSRAANWIDAFLSSTFAAGTGGNAFRSLKQKTISRILQGVVMVRPVEEASISDNKPRNQFSFSIPTLVIVVDTHYPSSYNSLRNPFVIVIMMRWGGEEANKKMMKDGNFDEDAISLWISRTILKFANVIQRTNTGLSNKLILDRTQSTITTPSKIVLKSRL